jgi:hypothetical protein
MSGPADSADRLASRNLHGMLGSRAGATVEAHMGRASSYADEPPLNKIDVDDPSGRELVNPRFWPPEWRSDPRSGPPESAPLPPPRPTGTMPAAMPEAVNRAAADGPWPESARRSYHGGAVPQPNAAAPPAALARALIGGNDNDGGAREFATSGMDAGSRNRLAAMLSGGQPDAKMAPPVNDNSATPGMRPPGWDGAAAHAADGSGGVRQLPESSMATLPRPDARVAYAQMTPQGQTGAGGAPRPVQGQSAQQGGPDFDRIAATLSNPNVLPIVKQNIMAQLEARRKGPAAPPVEIREVNGRLVAVRKDNLTSRDVTPPNLPPAVRTLTDPAERARLGIPADDKRPYQVDGSGRLSVPGGQQVNIDQRAQGAGDKKAEEAIVERFAKVWEDGDSARTDLAHIEQLRSMGDKVKTGGVAAIQGYLANWGIKLGDNVGVVEAYSAMIDRLTPQQRVPGSGATSDFDARMFKGSLARLVNTPEGNKLIIDTMEAQARDKMARGDIAARSFAGEITRKEAIEEMRKLPDPLAGFKQWREQQEKAAKEKPQGDKPAPSQPSAAPHRARNPKTGEEIISDDGVNWRPAR